MNRAAIIIGLGIGAVAIAYAAQAAAASNPDAFSGDPGQQPDTLPAVDPVWSVPAWMKWGGGSTSSPESRDAAAVSEWLPAALSYEPKAAMMDADANVQAFLEMIGYSEGATYNTLVGGGTFDSYADHPRRVITINSNGRVIKSTAAGKYQALAGTWDDFCRARGKHDFSPASQDEFAVWAIQRRGALDDVKAGRFDVAVNKCRLEWASLPGAGYGQPERRLADLRAVYQSNGGIYG